MLRRLGAPDWFNLGDRDLGMHLARSWRLHANETLSQATGFLTRALGIEHSVVPMSDAPVRTEVETEAGWLDFQRYFVELQCNPTVRSIRFTGTPEAKPSPGFEAALARSDLAAVVICPSNPYLSVDPILAVDGVRDAIAASDVPVIAVSPLVGGKALKGPLSKLMTELGKDDGNVAIARHYKGLVDCIVIDESDAGDADALQAEGVAVTVTNTVMRDAGDREMLARSVLALAG